LRDERRWAAEGGEGHTLAQSVEGAVFVWGTNLMKQLGLPGIEIRSTVPELLVMGDGVAETSHKSLRPLSFSGHTHARAVAGLRLVLQAPQSRK
jgi:hypothetical protein